MKGTTKYIASYATSITLQGIRVVVVDDEEGTRDLLTTILAKRGVDVVACSSAAEALTAVERFRPSLLITDIGIPDGYALIRKVRAPSRDKGGDTPAVALTAYARSDDRMRALAARFQMHVPKPVDALELVMVIASLVGRKSVSA